MDTAEPSGYLQRSMCIYSRLSLYLNDGILRLQSLAHVETKDASGKEGTVRGTEPLLSLLLLLPLLPLTTLLPLLPSNRLPTHTRY